MGGGRGNTGGYSSEYKVFTPIPLKGTDGPESEEQRGKN